MNTNVKKLMGMLDKPKVKDLPPPEGISQDVIDAVKNPKVDNRLYGYTDLATKIQNMPVAPKIPTKINELDELLDGGMQPGELMILSGMTKHGKTSLAQTMSYLQASEKIPSVWFTLEMSWQELTRKFMMMDYEVEMLKKPSSLPIYYPIDNRGLSLDWLEEQVMKAKNNCGAKIVFIDHLHFLVPLADSKSNVSFLVGAIVRAVKQIAVRCEIPIVLICHTKKLDVNIAPDINSMRDCLAEGQLVYSNGKLIPVEKIKAGNHVISRGTSFSLQDDKVKDQWKTGIKKIYRLTTRSGRTIECSDGHRFLATTYKKTNKFGANQGCGIAGWTKLKDLSVGQKIAVPQRYPDLKIKPTITKEQATVLGWIIGDGHITKEGHTEITVNKKPEVKFLLDLLKRAFDIDAKFTPYLDKKAFRVYLSNRRFPNSYLKFIRDLKYQAISTDKHVPLQIFEQPKEIVAGFLSGLFHADGYVGKNRETSIIVRFDTISELLAKQVKHLLLRFGIVSFLRSQNMKAAGFRTESKNIYTVSIFGSNLKTFAEQINFFLHKKKKLEKLMKGWHYKDKPRKSNVRFEKIKSIEYVGEKETYDIAVVGKHNSLENNSFCVNDILTHNSSFIAQESDFTLIMWRERKQPKRGQDIMENADVYTDRTICSLEANRRNGKTKKFLLGMINGRFHPYHEYQALAPNISPEELEEKLKRVQQAVEGKRKVAEDDKEIDVEDVPF